MTACHLWHKPNAAACRRFLIVAARREKKSEAMTSMRAVILGATLWLGAFSVPAQADEARDLVKRALAALPQVPFGSAAEHCLQ